MTREQAEDLIDIVSIVALVIVTIFVALQVVQPIAMIVVSGLLFAWVLISYKVLDWIDER